MRFVTRQYNNKPRKLTLRSTMTAWNNIASTGNTGLIAKSIYRDPYNTTDGTASKVIDKLNTWYHYKCAYCERIYKLDVEHYRPKAEVRNENNVIVQVTNAAGNLVDHPGYYWLCYEWSNLIPSCISCNREGGKNSKFPTIHHYEHRPVFTPPTLDYNSCLVGGNPLLTEQPYLLNPELDNPVGFFKFVIDPDKKGIRIEGDDADRRGEITADICKLNRSEVKYDRVHKVVLPIRKTMLSYVKMLSTGRRTVAQFKNSVEELIQKLYDDSHDERLDHTLLRNYIIRSRLNFESVVIPFISEGEKKILLEAFINYQPV
jgi:hypothetical protein